MSIVRVAWAMQQTTGSASRKAVLIALADCEHGETGKCCPSMDTMAERLEMGVRTVRRALAELEEQGLISRERSRRQDGSLGVYHYTFRPDTILPPAGAAATPPAGNDRATGQSGRSRGTGSEPETTLEPVELEAASESTGLVLGGTRKTWKVDGKAVTPPEYEDAVAILNAWNGATGQALRSTDWLAKIVMRIREHPELPIGDHVDIILANLNHPWWTGPPTPSVVYGNGAQFERAMMATDYGTTAGGDAALAVALDEQRRMEAGR